MDGRRPPRSIPRPRSYLVLGVALALAAPAGLAIVRAVDAGARLTVAWAMADVRALLVTYAYVTFSSVAVFAILGHVLGRRVDRLGLLSITDPLTGLLNRRAFGQRLVDEIRRGRRHHRPTCVLSVDLDHLKAINDGHGHQAGDDALVAVGRALLRTVRVTDSVARVGGDEFAVLLPETSAAQGSALSQRILAEVARHSQPSGGRLDVSIGVAELSPTELMGAEGLLAVADAALYRAKAAGGGRSAIAGAPPLDASGPLAAPSPAAALTADRPDAPAPR